MKNLDTEWLKNRDRLEGLVLRIQEALKDVEGLPDDLNNPETMDEAEAVNALATTLYEFFSEGMETSEALMVGKEVERAYENIQDEKGNTRDWYSETAHSRADF